MPRFPAICRQILINGDGKLALQTFDVIGRTKVTMEYGPLFTTLPHRHLNVIRHIQYLAM